MPPFRPFAEAIAGYGETAGPERLRADLGPAGAALVRIAPRLAQLLPDLGPLPALQPDEERFRLLDAAAQFFTALSGRAALPALDELLAVGMVRAGAGPERYEFGHALVRHAVHDSLTPSRQARLHRRLTHGLEAARAQVPGCTDPAEIVAQYARSTALPGAEAGVAAAIEAADLAQVCGCPLPACAP